MYRHYCKDTNCPGHTKSWERCCDLRAFSAATPQRKPEWMPMSFMRGKTQSTPTKKMVFA